ncbi:MAG TPA: HNH endonuclease [Phycisphaerae bacterium]|nr:HNH endonuclease [Phycisphaerae bacterium]
MKVSIRPVPGYANLYARADGVILYQTPRGLRRRMTRRHKNWLFIRMKKSGRVHELSVAGLMLEAFVGPCPPAHRTFHLNGNPLNNRLSNLAWKSYGVRPGLRVAKKKKKKKKAPGLGRRRKRSGRLSAGRPPRKRQAAKRRRTGRVGRR